MSGLRISRCGRLSPKENLEPGTYNRFSQEVQGRQGWQAAELAGEAAEVLDGADAVGVERVVDVAGEIGADDIGWDRDAGRPFANEGFDVGQAGVAAGHE